MIEIKLSNGHEIRYMVASGALAFDGKGWFWERLLVWIGLIKPELFTVVIKSLTRHPRRGNLRWWNPLTWLPFSPWSCVRFLLGGAVNKVGLTNPGIDEFLRKICPKLDFKKYALVASIFGTQEELVEMAEMLNRFDFVAIEVNVSCPNDVEPMAGAQMVIDSVKAVKRVSRHPLIAKLSVDQDYLVIARGLIGVAEAIALNSVPWATAFPNGERTPLWMLEKKVGGGGGGVSGKPAQAHNWTAVGALFVQGALPVIAPSIMDFEDMGHVRRLGAKAVSFGTIHLPSKWKPWTIFTNPCKPTSFVKMEARERKEKDRS